MLTATDAFMCSLEDWLKAARADDFDTARIHATHLVKSGELLAIHPDFVRAFAQHFPNVEPKDALLYLCKFMVCATDGRARVLKKWIEDNRPFDSMGNSRQP